jgi:polysaccharide pyruvyl transferase WcaK-like protein
MLLPLPALASQVKSVVAELDLVVSGRMHLVIAALGAGVPAAGIPYQNKFEGLFRHFGLDDVIVTPAEAFGNDGLADLIIRLLPRQAQLKQQVSLALHDILECAERNFGNLSR